jgi:hypothetical protein
MEALSKNDSPLFAEAFSQSDPSIVLSLKDKIA